MKPLKTSYWYWTWKTFLRPSRLRKKFTLAFLFSGLIPLLLIGLASLYLANRVHRIDIATLEESVSIQLRDAIIRSIDDIATSFQLDVAYDELAPINFNEQPRILQTIAERHFSVRELSFICTTPAFCTVGKETMRLVEGETSAPPLLDQSKSPEFQAVRTLNRTYLHTEETRSGIHVLVIAAPVINQRMEIVGVIRGELDLDFIQQLVNSVKLGGKGYAYVVREDGVIIAHPNHEDVGVHAADLPSVIDTFTTHSSSLEHQETHNFVYQNIEGEMVSGTGVFVPETKWGVIVEWPRAETERLIGVIMLQIVLFALLAAIAFFILSGVLAFRIIAPIAYLTQSANIIGSGNFNYRTSVKTGDELEDLGNHLNTMAEHLKSLEQLHELEIKTKYLSESLKKEQEFSKLKDQFITTVSHQFNTPLTVINWTLEEIAKPDADVRTIKEGFARIKESQRDIANIANDLITLSEIGFSYQMKKIERIDLGALTQHVLTTLATFFAVKKIPLPAVTIEGDVTLDGNTFSATKAIENLVDNALAYSHEGGEIAIKIEGTDRDVRFTVRDHGIGIPKEDQPSLFQEFFRARNAVQKKNVGTGLGLFLVKTIIEKGFGGTIFFESEEGKGSKFTFVLPKRREGTNPATPPLTKDPSAR